MKIGSIKFRWIYGACYEIVLPNGKVILTDPFITPNHLEGFTADDVTGADYILCSHTHYDHTSDIAYLLKKFCPVVTKEAVQTMRVIDHPKLIIGSMAAPYLSQCFDIEYIHIYPASDGTIYDFEDFELRVFNAKHCAVPSGRAVPSRACLTAKERFGQDGHGICDQVGWMEELDFVITTRNNFRLMIISGMPAYHNIYHVADRLRPNMVIRQFFGPPEDYARLLAPFHAQLYLPNHHEHIGEQTGVDIDEYVSRAGLELKEHDPYARLINPVPHQWYQLSLGVEPE